MLGQIVDVDEVRALVTQILAKVLFGSYLAICDGTPTEEKRRMQEEYGKTGGVPYESREPDAMATFFDGLESVESGLVSVSLWRPDLPAGDVSAIRPLPSHVDEYGGVARKP